MNASQPLAVVSFAFQSCSRCISGSARRPQMWPNPRRARRIATPRFGSLLLARIFLLSGIFAVLAGACVPAHAQVIQTIAGGVNPSHSPSENACVPVQSVATHGTDVYFAGCAQIFKVNAQGQFTHVAGTGINAFSPDGTAAASANFDNIASLSLDSAGNIYFNEAFSNRVREIVASTGLIKTVAGTGTSGYSGDGGLATSAEISGGFRMGIFVDASGNVFIADQFNDRVRKVAAATGIITTVAGDGTAGFSGDAGLATSAQLHDPRGVVVDGAGNIFIADAFNSRIREVAAATGIITTVAGNGTAGFAGDGGPATSAEIETGVPSIALDASGNLFIADVNNSRIREVVAATGKIKTVAGNGQGLQSGCNGGVNACIGVGGPATQAVVPGPLQVAVDSSGNLYIPTQTEFRNMIDEVVASTGDLQIFAANGAQDFTGTNGPAVSAQLNVPNFAATDGAGNVFIADANNNVIYEIVAATGILKIVAGTGILGYSGDGGPATGAELANPFTVVVDGSGNLFIADTVNSVIREVIAETGFIKTVAGNASAACDFTLGDGGPATSASLCFPNFAALDSHGNIFIADSGYSLIREVNASTGMIQTVAGSGGGNGFGYSGDGGPATSALMNGPTGVFADSSGNFFIADQFNNVIREVNAAGTITTVAGNTSGIAGFSGDGGPAVGAELFLPGNVWGDSSGNFFVSDFNNEVIRKFTVGGTIQTVAGNRVFGVSGDGGPATSAELDGPDAVFVEPSGSLLIADIGNGRIRIVGQPTTTALSPSANPSPADQPVMFTATITPAGGGVPIGSVNFLDNGTVIGQGSVNAEGQATFTTSSLAGGPHSITAQYFGTNYPGSSSSVLNETITTGANPTTTALMSSLNPSIGGQSVTFTASVVGLGVNTPTGFVNFLDNGTQIGSVLLNESAQAMFATSTLTIGVHPITAQYVGDSNFAPSKSTAVSQVVNTVNSNSQNIPFSPSPTPETQVATIGNPADPAAQSLALTLSSVTNPLNVSVIFTYDPTDVSTGTHGVGIADGICEAGANESTDFDCRLAANFTYPAPLLPNGDRLVPHVIPSHNNMGVWVRVIATRVSDGQPAVAGVDYGFGVDWFYAWNANPSLANPTPNPDYLPGWNNQNQQMYDRPGENVDIAFVANISTFSKSCSSTTCVGTADPGKGGKTKTLNDIVVAAVPNPPSGGPDTVELLVPEQRRAPFQYLKSFPMLVSFELEDEKKEKSDPTALTLPHSLTVATLDQKGNPIDVQYPAGAPTTFTYNSFFKVYYILLSPAPYKTDGTVYTMQIDSDLLSQPVDVKFVVKKSEH